MLLKRHLILVVAGILLLLCVATSAFLLFQYSKVHIQAKDTSGAIFAVASTTGDTYFAVMSDGKVGIGTGSDKPATALQVSGTLRLTEKSPEACGLHIEGAIAYNPENKHFWGCDGYNWRQLDR